MREIKFSQSLRMAMCVTDENEKEREEEQVSSDMKTSKGPGDIASPSLAALLLCREYVPSVMEYEKAVLVMKEHDYAKVPEFTQLTPLLRHLTTSGEPSPSARESSQPEALTSVQDTISLYRSETLLGLDNGVSPYLKTMVSLQATLIHELQEQSYIREIETNTVRREKEQLEARLERMERRLNILQKHSLQDEGGGGSPAEEETTPTTPNNTPTQRSRHSLKPNSIVRLARVDSGPGRRKSRSRSSSIEPLMSTNTPSKHLQRQSKNLFVNNSLEVTHRALKRDLVDRDNVSSNHIPRSKRSRSSSGGRKFEASYVQTKIPYSGLNLVLPTRKEDEDEENKIDIKIPLWKRSIVPLTLSRNASITEDMSSEAFARRHSKLETDEKRRKRWDAQRIRQKFHHEQLLKRYMMKEGLPSTQEKKKDELTTFQPKLEEVEGIDITDTLVVCAFGQPLPNLPPCSFQLPNFNPHVSSKGGRGKSRSRLSNSTNSMDESGHVTSSHVT